MKQKTAVVIGGGPAGMIAAGFAAKRGLRTVLVEKNPRLGKKLSITGKGRCNLTNICDVSDMMEAVPRNASFLYSAFYTFTNEQLMSFFEELGVPLKTERGGRVFPVSDRAQDIVNALERFLAESGVHVMHGEVKRLIQKEGRIIGIEMTDGAKYRADCVLVATGGKSYPQTGSTGDGYRFAEQAGHTVVSPTPSLVPLVTEEEYPLSGLSLKNVAITVYQEQKKIYEDFGEMLFTHYGVSGPIILSASAHMRENTKYRLFINWKPALTEAELDQRILRDFEAASRKQFRNALDALLPKKMIPVMVEKSGIDPDLPVNQISKEQRKQLVKLFQAFPLTVIGKRPIREAIITSGGVSTKEVNPGTMESKKTAGLYFAGEVLDVDAYTGGFNLQIAFSTGYLAGMHMGEDMDERGRTKDEYGASSN